MHVAKSCFRLRVVQSLARACTINPRWYNGTSASHVCINTTSFVVARPPTQKARRAQLAHVFCLSWPSQQPSHCFYFRCRIRFLIHAPAHYWLPTTRLGVNTWCVFRSKKGVRNIPDSWSALGLSRGGHPHATLIISILVSVSR